MNWKFQSDQPIYTQLIEQMKIAIASGTYAPGERLPSVRELSVQAGVNPNTMQRALGVLEQEGLVHSQRTSGRFVTEERAMIKDAKWSLAQVQVQKFLSAMKQLGYAPGEIVAMLQGELKGGIEQ